MPKEKIALLGFGDIANRLALRLNHADVTGIKRSLIDHDIAIEAADCRNQNDMNRVMKKGFDVVVMTFTPTEISDQGYKKGYVDTVSTVLTALKNQSHKPRLLVFVSSTSVYGQTDASWVDEQSPAAAKSHSGQRLREAEKLIADSGFTYCCIRFSGIYGPGRRRLIEQVISGKGTPETPMLYSNRIHADDCAGVLAHIIEKQKTQAIETLYLASDCEPVPLYDVKQWMAKTLGFNNNHLRVDNNISEKMRRGSKRCSNKRLLDSGYQFIYPSFREGYGELLKAQ